MNPKEALLQIRALFEDMPQVVEPVAPVAPEVTKVEMAEYSLVDGTKVMISVLEIGGMVEMADGTPAPAGEHQLMDGTSIQVDELGAIVEISSPKEDVIVEEPVAPAALTLIVSKPLTVNVPEPEVFAPFRVNAKASAVPATAAGA